MSHESHLRYLENSTLRSVQRAQVRAKDKTLRREELIRLRVQTVEPWKRILCVFIGLLITGGGAFLLMADVSLYAVVTLAVIGLAFIALGTLGRKKTVDAVLRASGDGFADGVIQAIFEIAS